MKNFLMMCLAFMALAFAGCGKDDDKKDEAPIEQTLLAVGGVYHLAGNISSDAWFSEDGVTCEPMTFPIEATFTFLQGEDENGLLLSRVAYVWNDTIVEGLLDEAGNFVGTFDNDPYSNTAYSGMFLGGGDGYAYRYTSISTTAVPATESCAGIAGTIELYLEGERDYYHSP